MTTALKNAAMQLAREQAKVKREALEMAMLQQIRGVRLDAGLSRQHRFHADRKWAFDFAWPARKWALEVDGGTWTKGRHNTGTGYRDDCIKLAEAALLGWRVLRATSDQVTGGIAIKWLEKALLPKAAAPSVLSLLEEAEPDKKAMARPKRDYVRNKTLREAYREIPCQHCGKDDGTVCCAHSNWSIHGKGMSIKADDSRGASLCAACHVPILDQGSKLSEEERKRMWWDAHVKSIRLLRSKRLWPAGVQIPDVHNYPF